MHVHMLLVCHIYLHLSIPLECCVSVAERNE